MKLNSWAEFDKIRLNMKIKKVTIENRIFVRHINPDKSIGGFVEETAKVEKTSYIEFSVRVFGNARISGNARVFGDARISENAQVYENAWVSENARVFGDARVFGNAQVYGNAWVSENAQVSGDVRVFGDARISENARVSGDVRVFGNARIFGDKIISILKTIQVFQYCVSITDNFIFCGCNKFTHQEVRNLIYEKSGAKEYMTEKQFEILKEIVLKAIEF